MDGVINPPEHQLTEDFEKNGKDIANMLTSFNDQLEKLKKILMEIEIQLYERIEEANGNFEHIIQDFVNEFIELVQSQFVLLRDEETNFNESLLEAVHRQATTLLAMAPDGSELPEPLHDYITDKDTISALALGTRDLHMQRIDAREDRLITRSRNWVKDLCEKMQRWDGFVLVFLYIADFSFTSGTKLRGTATKSMKLSTLFRLRWKSWTRFYM